MGWNRALQKNIFFKLRKNVFSRMLGHLSPVGWNRTLQQLWQVVRAVWLWKADYRKPRKLHSGKKTIFQALKKCFFGTALVKLRQARLCKKNNFQALNNCFFVCLLSNLPTPPRYLALARSKLRKCIQYITKNALRIWGTLDLLWWKFARI